MKQCSQFLFALGLVLVLGQDRMTGAASPLLPVQSSSRGAFVLMRDNAGLSWGYPIGDPIKLTRTFPEEAYMPLLPGPNLSTYQTLPFPRRLASEGRVWKAVHCNDQNVFLLDEEGLCWHVPLATGLESLAPAVPSQMVATDGTRRWRALALANGRSILIDLNGALYELGANWTNGAVRVGTGEAGGARFVWCAAESGRQVAVDESGRLFGWGTLDRPLGSDPRFTASSETPVRLLDPPDGASWIKVVLGSVHGAGLSSEGNLFAWGSNDRGQVGSTNYHSGRTHEIARVDFPEGVARWVDVWAGGDFTLAMGDDGRLYEWGSEPWWPSSEGDKPTVRKYPPPPGADTWSQVSVARYHRMALTGDGRLFAWGGDWSGQLGQGRAAGYRRLLFKPSPSFASLADDSMDEIGLPAEGTGNLPPGARLLSPLHRTETRHVSALELKAQVIDPDDNLATVPFLINGVRNLPAWLNEEGLFEARWTDAPQGLHLIQVVATDTIGSTNELEHNWVWLLPSVSLHAVHPKAREPGGAVARKEALFEVVRTGETDEDLEVVLSLSYSSTATVNVDFSGVDFFSFVTIPPGTNRIEVTVTPLADDGFDPDETVTVYIRGADAAPGERVYATVVIDDALENEGSPNQLPVCQLGRPGEYAAFEHGYDVFMHVQVSDPDGMVDRVEWYDGGELLNVHVLLSGSYPSSWFTWSGPAPGDHLVRARVVDNEGGVTWSKPMHLRILSPDERDSGPNRFSLETIDPIAVRGAEDLGAVRVRRTGDASRSLSPGQIVTSDPGALHSHVIEPSVSALMAGQVEGTLTIRAPQTGAPPGKERVTFKVNGESPADGSGSSTIYLVTVPERIRGKPLVVPSPVVLEASRTEDGGIAVEMFTNPETLGSEQMSFDLQHWGNLTGFRSPTGRIRVVRPVIQDVSGAYFRVGASED